MRVFITGLGIASPLGCEIEGFWSSLLQGASGVQYLDSDEYQGLPARIGAQVDQQEIDRVLTKKEARRISRSSQLAIIAADQAIAQADLADSEIDLTTVAVIIGSSIGGFSASDPIFRDYYVHGKQSVFAIPLSMNSGPSANVSIRHGYSGPNMTVDAACSSAAHSIGYAYNLIRMGQISLAVTGGADSPFSRGVFQAWCNLRVVSTRNDTPAEACRPFSADRDGLVLGEGAGVLVLESETSVRNRGVRPLAELTGYGSSADSHHITKPSVDGPRRAMRSALQDAGLSPESIDCINAHATGTLLNDSIETQAIQEVFGPHTKRLWVSGNKAALGHSIGASGALELIACVLAVRDQVIPPTINFRKPDPECDLRLVANQARPMEIQHIMSNSFAFGGSNAALIVRKIAQQP